MNQGQTVFAQIAEFLSHNEFNRCVARYDGNGRVRRLSCWEQFLAMAFAQLTYRESLRDIEVCLGVQHRKLYHSGFRNPVKRSALAEANENRDWRIYADFAHSLIAIARPLYADEELGLDLDATVYALDATTIDLCLALFPWAHFRRAKGAVKLHAVIDLRGAIPVFIDITDGKVHDVNVLDVLVPEPGAYLIMDRGYLDFARLYQLQQALSFFVIRAKCTLQFRRRYSHPIDQATGVRSDQTIVLTGPKTALLYPLPLRRQPPWCRPRRLAGCSPPTAAASLRRSGLRARSCRSPSPRRSRAGGPRRSPRADSSAPRSRPRSAASSCAGTCLFLYGIGMETTSAIHILVCLCFLSPGPRKYLETQGLGFLRRPIPVKVGLEADG